MPPLTVKVVLVPGAMVVLPDVTRLGEAFTITFIIAVSEHVPLLTVTI